MAETGLLVEWRRRYAPDAGPCYGTKYRATQRKTEENIRKGKEKEKKDRLTLLNLSGAFVILLVGIVASIFVFIGEMIMFRYLNKNKIRAFNNRVQVEVEQNPPRNSVNSKRLGKKSANIKKENIVKIKLTKIGKNISDNLRMKKEKLGEMGKEIKLKISKTRKMMEKYQKKSYWVALLENMKPNFESMKTRRFLIFKKITKK